MTTYIRLQLSHGIKGCPIDQIREYDLPPQFNPYPYRCTGPEGCGRFYSLAEMKELRRD